MQQLTQTQFETNKVILQKLQHHHLNDLLQAGKNPKIWQYVLSNYCKDKDTLEHWFNKTAQYQADKQLPLVIIDKKNNQLVGSTRLFSLDFNHDKLEIGHTFITPEFQRCHINTHTKYLLLSYAFEQLSAARVELRTHENNQKSRNAIERLGAQFEGIAWQDRKLIDGSYRNSAVFSVTQTIWPNVKQQLEAKL
ncbi:GNAT family protein [Pseudoalteromonas sp. MMG024]|uniref:GNAT family N-acetyltransferase n=1 Tax=Pseudoalteromonas sp. MMG024 TaxID=2909980 RepID=UPI001F31D4AC|nr:GNAT family protein [Pseudoalteromonas sp. MMG024]MCF6456445.1 GNAT family N-acetyltransferase [Pseudoalteromonas sp. MMG024]